MSERPFGTTPEGDGVRLFTLAAGAGLVARVTDDGATLVELYAADREGEVADVILGFDSVDGYVSLDNPDFGATIGRVANRIANSELSVDGRRYTLARNEAPPHLHGGVRRSFDKVVWEVVRADDRRLELRYVSPDGEEGYPGEVEATATYRLAEDALTVEYRATTDATTPMNMTNHAYFNLAGAGSGPILDHELEIRADRYTPVDHELIPTGQIRSVDGTPLDCRRPRAIGERIEQLRSVPGALGYDHNYVLGGDPDKVRFAALVRDPASGRILELSTNQPCLQLYSGNRIDAPIRGKAGKTYRLHGALCLEPQHAPDAVHHPRFGSILLEPGEEHVHTSRYRLATDGDEGDPRDV